MQQKHSLAFTVVSDPGNTIAGRLGILTRPSPEARAAQLHLGLDLTGVNADGTVTLPMPATVILDAGRTVRWIDVHPDYSTRTEPLQIINALDHLRIDHLGRPVRQADLSATRDWRPWPCQPVLCCGPEPTGAESVAGPDRAADGRFRRRTMTATTTAITSRAISPAMI